MARRSGLAPARVERQLARAADAIAEGSGERPAVPPRDRAADGEPYWELRDDVLTYALREGETIVWSWRTREVATLAFWAMRDATFRLAHAWEEETRPPGEDFRAGAARERWEWLLGLADESWCVRHRAWLDATDASGFVGWPNPAEVALVVERVAAKLAHDAEQPHGELPGLRPRDDAHPWLETHGDELCYRVRAGDRDLRDDRTTDVTELLFWVFEPVTREMAREATDGDWRGRWVELMALVNPAWGPRAEAMLG